MEITYTFTEKELAQAFKKANEIYLCSKEDYKEVDDSDECANEQARHLIELLTKK